MNKEIIIITGGTSGLGLELVKQSIARGLFVCNIDWNQSKMKELEKDYEENYKGFVGDISDESFIKNTITEISKIGNIKYLVNNAGEPSFKLPCDYSKEDIEKCFKGLQGMIIVSTEALKVKE